MISRGAMDRDSNRARKRHSRMECLAVDTLNEEFTLVLGFEPKDLRGIVTPYNDALVI